MSPRHLRDTASALEDIDIAGDYADAVDALRAAAAEIELLRARVKELEEAAAEAAIYASDRDRYID